MKRWRIKVEDGVPIPPRTIGESLAKIIWQMKPGQSFLLTGDRSRVEYAYDVAKHIGVHIVTRKVNGAGVRVWRVTKEQKRQMNRSILAKMRDLDNTVT